MHGPDHPEAARDMIDLYGVYRRQGDASLAQTNLDQALVIMQSKLGKHDFDLATTVRNICQEILGPGDLPGKQAGFERALEIDLEVYGPDHLHVARDLNDIGAVLRRLGDFSEAKANFEKALQICNVRLGPEHEITKSVQENLLEVTRAEVTRAEVTRALELY
jgi:tetratricopeptide (TPR) repeat protein